jgi:hypothetical protein
MLLGAAILGVCAWAGGGRSDLAAAIRPTYDQQTGKLTQLSYDSDHDGRPDTWTDMDGAKPLRTRIDKDGDGKIDRWEEYDATGALVKVGVSTRGNGIADAWLSPGVDGIERVEISSTADPRKIDRWEYYDAAKAGPDGRRVLVRVEEDTIGDGKPHKWETYSDGSLETVAFDEDGDGAPDRRFTYRRSVLTRIESHADRAGRYSVRTELAK